MKTQMLLNEYANRKTAEFYASSFHMSNDKAILIDKSAASSQVCFGWDITTPAML